MKKDVVYVVIMKQRNLVGNKYGKLIVLESCGKAGKDNHYYSKVRCECGKEYLVPDTELIYGRRLSCAKCVDKLHGMTNTRLFNIWQSMKQRCNCPTCKVYKYYGGRGIKMSDEWVEKDKGFINFYNWSLKNGYKDNLTIDRIDVNGNYEPSNCRWVDMYFQANNKRNNRLIAYNGITDTLANWSKKYNINSRILGWRIRNGWDIEKALTLKPKVGRNQYE